MSHIPNCQPACLMPSQPPPIPTASSCIYTACYCEENVYKLAQDPYFSSRPSAPASSFVVFVSNVGELHTESDHHDSDDRSHRRSVLCQLCTPAATRTHSLPLPPSDQTVLIWKQRSGVKRGREEPVCWDYHVILVSRWFCFCQGSVDVLTELADMVHAIPAICCGRR